MRRQRGFGRLEVLEGVGLLAFSRGAFLTTLDTGFRATATHDQLVTGENLVRTHLETMRGADCFVPLSVPYLIPPGNDPGAYALPPPNVTPHQPTESEPLGSVQLNPPTRPREDWRIWS